MNKIDTEIIKTSCFDLSYEGKGVCRDGDRVIFVTGMFPGDEGEVEILYKRNGVFFGRIKKLDKLSENRIKPVCKVCTACGGCSFQAYDYKAQLEFKRKLVSDQFRKVGHMEVDVSPTLGMEEPYNYRNKIQVPFGWDRWHQNVVYGFYKEGTHCIVSNDDCSIEDRLGNKIISEFCKILNELHIDPYNEKNGEGYIRHALVRTSKHFKENMLVIVSKSPYFPRKDSLISLMKERIPEVTTLVENINPSKTNVILGEKEKVLFGRGYIEDVLCGVKFRIAAKSFYQTNPVMTEVLYNTAMEYASITPNDVVFDAYSGIGTIGMIAARRGAKNVIAVEVVEDAVHDAVCNAKANGIDNFIEICGDATEYLVEQAKSGAKFDTIFMDPPRKGSTLEFINSVKLIKPNKVVYVSCNPSTLARDCALFADSYVATKVQPVDLFPQTPHVETIVLLEIKK